MDSPVVGSNFFIQDALDAMGGGQQLSRPGGGVGQHDSEINRRVSRRILVKVVIDADYILAELPNRLPDDLLELSQVSDTGETS